jgi:HD-GYP domain-containing protein (c-di-GMP phosphodiesterase class II)
MISHAGDEPHHEDHQAPVQWSPENIVPDELKDALKDRKMAKEKKAKVVYDSSVELMKRLLDDPKTENIHEVKKEIADVVDAIILDDATARHMLAITTHDYYTYTHSVNVGVLSIMLSKALFTNLDSHNMHELGAGFFLHDLGKVRVDPAIINKQGKLTEEEMKKMRIHPWQSYKILVEANQLSEECRIIALQHHEREDGRGYPRRLRGEQIHIYGRIGCIADVYDALTAERSYKPKLSPFEALRIMKEEMINHFHKDIFERFVLLFR